MSAGARAPLVSVADIDDYSPPIETISEECANALSLLAHERAKESPGTITTHERGVGGEYVVTQNLGIEDQFDDEIYEYGDGGADFVFKDKRVDVKTTGPRANNPELWVNTRQQLRADWYVLVQQLNLRTYQIIGYAPRDRVDAAPVRRILCDDYVDKVRAVEPDLLTPWPY